MLYSSSALENGPFNITWTPPKYTMSMNGINLSMRALHPGWSLILCLLLGTTGCASKGDVSGKVLYRGKPLPGGTVTFLPAGGKGVFFSPIQEDGSYSLTQVPSGEVTIIVETESKNPAPKGNPQAAARAKKYKEQMRKKMEQVMPGRVPPRLSSKEGQYVPIPASYKDPEKSGLTYTVTGGTQTHDIELK
jgi:hypothetical protein